MASVVAGYNGTRKAKKPRSRSIANVAIDLAPVRRIDAALVARIDTLFESHAGR
jgi:hypothetical protein